MIMKKHRNIIFYDFTIAFFSCLMYWFFVQGKTLEIGENIKPVENTGTTMWENFTDSFIANLHHPLALLLSQIVTIIIVAKFFGWICVKLKQPSVIGEMIAGIVLGPSLIRLIFPRIFCLDVP